MHVQPKLRSSLAMLVCGGEIVWLESVGAAEGFAPNGKTKRLLYIELVTPLADDK